MIIPAWMYRRMVAQYGQAMADRKMAEFSAVAVDDWQEAVDLEAAKERVNRG